MNCCCNNSNKILVENLQRTNITVPISLSQPFIDKSRLLFGLIDKKAYNKAMNGENTYVQLDIVWNNEHHPICIADIVYRIYRSYKYKRVQDIQSLYLHYQNKELVSVESGNFTENPSYTFQIKKLTKHDSHKYKIEDFSTDREKNRIIYISTWNHIFSKEDYNKNLNKDLFHIGYDFPLYEL